MLAYLVGRDRGAERRELAELLWAPGRTGSVHQAVHTMRACPGGDRWLSRGRGPVRLRVRSDAQLFERLVRRGRPACALRLWRGTPYQGLSLPAAPAFEDWLQGERLRLETVRRVALARELERLEHAGALPQALEVSRHLLALDPLDETTHRTAMRLHLQRDDLRGARAAFERCRDRLADELGVAPLAETLELGEAIEAAERAVATRSGGASLAAVPPALLRPPGLVGRRDELARLEAAWANGAIAMVLGPGGMGKTRLALDAARRRGVHLRLEGLAGDREVPYASLGRVVGQVLQELPGLHVGTWVRRELQRVAPEVTLTEPTGGALAPSIAASGRLRQAFAALLAAAREACDAIVIDDLHAFDAESSAVVVAGLADRETRRGALVVAARDDELADAARRALRGYADAGWAVPIPLLPLDAAAIEALIEPLGMAAGAALARDVFRYAGGNPLFVVETLKGLLVEGGSVDDADLSAAAIDPPQRVTDVIEWRLEGLEDVALDVARVLALAPGATSDHVAAALDLEAHEVAAALGALEAAELFDEDGAAHDVVVDVVRAHAPAGVTRLLHRRIATALAAHGARQGLVAQHERAAREDR